MKRFKALFLRDDFKPIFTKLRKKGITCDVNIKLCQVNTLCQVKCLLINLATTTDKQLFRGFGRCNSGRYIGCHKATGGLVVRVAADDNGAPSRQWLTDGLKGSPSHEQAVSDGVPLEPLQIGG